jgi:ATP-binding cassette subfamily B protein
LGSNFINEIKNILITVLAAKLVIDGELTLGMMLSISYIIGQLNNPILQIIGFIHSAQDASIALERLAEIHNRQDEEDIDFSQTVTCNANEEMELENVHFRYLGSEHEVIKGVDLVIPANKITAIVGASGSGKTTLMKLLLKFYDPSEGHIKTGGVLLDSISNKAWRDQVGVVMQEGFIFDDTIAHNIAFGFDVVDVEKLKIAVEIAHIKEFIESLPLAYNSKIGTNGIGMSTGQKQRILIARAVYKDPKLIFFDEATSALDAKNERNIMDKLNVFFKERTAVVIAHRLSTVKKADQIIVLHEGVIIERGTHEELVDLKGNYYDLVKEQLELERLDDNNKKQTGN